MNIYREREGEREILIWESN